MNESCSNCRKKLLTDHSFCPNCGFDLRDQTVHLSPNQDNKDNQIICSTCGSYNDIHYSFCAKCGGQLKLSDDLTKVVPESHKTESRWAGVRKTFIWSIILSTITTLLYVVKETSPIDHVAQNMVQGIIVRPLVVPLLALIFSSFGLPEKRIDRFNSSCTYMMATLTAAEFFKWIMIGNAS